MGGLFHEHKCDSCPKTALITRDTLQQKIKTCSPNLNSRSGSFIVDKLVSQQWHQTQPFFKQEMHQKLTRSRNRDKSNKKGGNSLFSVWLLRLTIWFWIVLVLVGVGYATWLSLTKIQVKFDNSTNMIYQDVFRLILGKSGSPLTTLESNKNCWW